MTLKDSRHKHVNRHSCSWDVMPCHDLMQTPSKRELQDMYASFKLSSTILDLPFYITILWFMVFIA